MNHRLTSDPPLGFASIRDGPHIDCAIGIDIEAATGEGCSPWEFSIWHNLYGDGAWQDLPLHRVQSRSNSEDGRAFYQGRLETAREQKTAFQFTLKLRQGTGPWQWIRDVSALENGEIIFRPTKPPNSDIHHYLGDLNETYNIREIECASPICICWEMCKSLSAADGIHSAWVRATLGTPKSVSRWFALVRHNPAWFAPRHGRDGLMLDADAIMLSFLRKDGLHLALVAVSGFDDITSVFRADIPGRIVMVSRNDQESAGAAHLFAAVGTTWHAAVETAMGATKGYVQQQTGCMGDSAAYAVLTPEEEQELTCWYDGLTYCTWNGLGQNLTPAKILEALDTLKGNDIHVDNLLIDDNWQSLDFDGADNSHYGWTGFEANTEHFPTGLKDLISTIRKSHPSISDIAVWHGIFGYWGGMSLNGQLARDYPMRTFKRQEGIFLGGGDLTTVDGTGTGRLYDDFYRFLVASGVTAVKTDTQSLLDYPQHADDRCNLISRYQDAWRGAMMKYFRGKTIACMAQIPQIAFRTMMRTDMPKLLMRNSDDFFPNEASSHTWHIFCNAHNAVLMEHLNVLPDWDMFQTDHLWSSFHSAARCLSGGPVYITDIPGKHDVSLIEQMTAKTTDGRSIILRPDTIGRTSEIYVAHAEARLLRVETNHQTASIIGIFNVGSKILREMINIAQMSGLVDGKSYVIRQYSSGAISGPWSNLDNFPVVEVEVAERGFEILTASPVHTYGRRAISVLGLLGKMTGAAAIQSLSISKPAESSQVKISVRLKALGSLGIYVPDDQVNLAAVKLAICGRDIPTLRHLELNHPVLVVDTISAWKEYRDILGQQNGMDNKALVFEITIPCT